MLPRVGVDRGAIKFVLAGANIMWSVSEVAVAVVLAASIPEESSDLVH